MIRKVGDKLRFAAEKIGGAFTVAPIERNNLRNTGTGQTIVA